MMGYLVLGRERLEGPRREAGHEGFFTRMLRALLRRG